MGAGDSKPALPNAEFNPEHELSMKDELLVDMLNSHPDEGAWVVTDPRQEDNPVIFASPAFTELTGYDVEEILGKNVRFLRGPKTDPDEVAKIRQARDEEIEMSICLLAYRKDGTTFNNQYFICPLRNRQGEVVYFLGCQVAVDEIKPGQQPENPGWVYSMGLRADHEHPETQRP